MSTKASSNGTGEQVRSQTVKNEDGDRKISLFLWRSPSGRETAYFSVATESLPCGVRTRSLRHGDWDKALEWAQAQVDDPKVTLDEIDIPKPETTAIKDTKPEKEETKKEQQPLPKWTLKTSPDEYLKRYPDGKHADLAKECIAAGVAS